MSTSGSMDDLSAIVTRLSKELEMMGLPGLASIVSHQQFQVLGYDGAMVVGGGQPAAEDVISDLISSNYNLIGLLKDLQRSKRQREDHAQQLIHDLQRSQWLLDKEKELSGQREREAAEAYEKERQANVRLQLSETLLKKKSEEHRQLAHESQLKENQWLHALRRRDQENHRLHQQLLKFLHSKSTGGGGSGGGIVPLQVEMRGSLVAAPARASSSESTRLRKQWDRTAAADDAKKLVEAKWKMALNSLEKDHQLLRADYFQLVDMVGRFLTNCSSKLTSRRLDTRPFSNVTEWIQLPVVSMRDRLEQIFRLVEAGLVSATFTPAPNNQMEIITGQQQSQNFDSLLEMDCVMPAIASTNRTQQLPLLEPVTGTAAAQPHQLVSVENQKVATNNCISSSTSSSSQTIIKDEVVAAAGLVTSSSRSSGAISTATTTKSSSSAAAAQQRPLKMVKSSSIIQHSTSTTGGPHQFDGLADDGPYYSADIRAFGNAGRPTINAESSAAQVVNQVDWNETDSPPAAVNISRNTNKSYSLLMGQQQQQLTSGTSSSPAIRMIGFKEKSDGLLDDDQATDDASDEMATLDTPCPSASNSRSGSCSSSSSLSSWKSQSGTIDPPDLPGGAGGIDEQFLRTCSEAASLVRDNYSPGSSAAAGPAASAQKSSDGTTLNLNRRTITARVRFVQHQQPTAAGDGVALATAAGARPQHPGDPVDLQCRRLITHHPPNSSGVDKTT